MSTLVLKNLSKGNMGNPKKLFLFSLFSYVKYFSLIIMNIVVWLSSLEKVSWTCCSVSDLALKILSEGNTGDQKKFYLFSLSSYFRTTK